MGTVAVAVCSGDIRTESGNGRRASRAFHTSPSVRATCHPVRRTAAVAAARRETTYTSVAGLCTEQNRPAAGGAPDEAETQPTVLLRLLNTDADDVCPA